MKQVDFIEPSIWDIYDDSRYLTRGEQQQLWYTGDELKEFFQDYKSSGEPSMMLWNPARTMRNKMFVLKILDEQDERRQPNGEIDWESLASVCQMTSSHRARIAHLQGIRDAQAVNVNKEFKVITQSFEAIREKRRSLRRSRKSKGYRLSLPEVYI